MYIGSISKSEFSLKSGELDNHLHKRWLLPLLKLNVWGCLWEMETSSALSSGRDTRCVKHLEMCRRVNVNVLILLKAKNNNNNKM